MVCMAGSSKILANIFVTGSKIGKLILLDLNCVKKKPFFISDYVFLNSVEWCHDYRVGTGFREDVGWDYYRKHKSLHIETIIY
jgi:hypothetical protein